MKVKTKMKPQSQQNIPQEDYIFYNTKEDEREAKSSIGVEYKVQQREYSGYNTNSYFGN